MENKWISVKTSLPSDEKEYTCYGEDWAGYKFFKAIYDQIKKEWYIMQGESRMKQFPTHWEPIN